MSLVFTQHAIQRVAERTKLSTNEISDIIENLRAVIIGRERKRSGKFEYNAVHQLFYSDIDTQYYVVVTDDASLEVITILNAEYEKRFSISCEQWSLAKSLNLRNKLGVKVPINDTRIPVYMYFTLQMKDRNGNRMKVQKLGKMQISDLDSLSKEEREATVQQYLDEKVSAALGNKNEFEYVVMRLGHGGNPIVLPYEYKAAK